jgi:hypothetical protein
MVAAEPSSRWSTDGARRSGRACAQLADAELAVGFGVAIVYWCPSRLVFAVGQRNRLAVNGVVIAVFTDERAAGIRIDRRFPHAKSLGSDYPLEAPRQSGGLGIDAATSNKRGRARLPRSRAGN